MRPQSVFQAVSKDSPPTSIRMEASSTCQLGCPICPTATGARRKILGWGHLDPEKFRCFLEKNPAIRHVELSHFGEIFLNPGLIDIIAIGAEKDIEFTAANGVNLNHVTDAQLEALVTYRVRYLSVAIDGATPETYSRYRINGNLARVLGNIQKINALKKNSSSPFPELEWQMVVFGHNQAELLDARAMANDLGMSFYPKRSWDPNYSPLRDGRKVRMLCREIIAGETYSRWKVYDDFRPLDMCRRMWVSPQLNWDGRLLGCCINPSSEFGNAFDSDLGELLKGERYRYAQGMLFGQNPPRPDLPCASCPIYRQKIYPWHAHRFLKITDPYLMRFAAVALIQNAARLKSSLLAPFATRKTAGKFSISG